MSAGDWKAMFRAAEAGNLTEVTHYLAEGIDPDFIHAEFQDTALVAAILAGHEDVAHLLLDRGASPTLRSPLEGLTPIEAARQAGLTRLEARLA